MCHPMRSGYAFLAALVFVCGLAAGAQAAPREIRLTVCAGHPLAGSAWVQAVPAHFIKEVGGRLAKTGRYKVKWTEAYGGTIAKLGNVLESTQDGVCDVGVVVYPFEAAKLFPHNFSYWVPFGTNDPMISHKITTAMHHKYPQLKQIFEKYNQKWLGSYSGSPYGMIGKFPVTKFEDVKGKKIGAAGPNLPWVTAAGAVGVATTLNLAYTSLQTGVYDALIIFIDPVGGFKLYEPAKHWNEAGFGSVNTTAISVNLTRFRSLPEEVRDAIDAGGVAWGPGSTQIGMDLAKKVADHLKKEGVQFHALSEEGRRKWADAMPNIPDMRAKDSVQKGFKFVPDLLRAYLKELEANGQKQPRQWKID